MDDIRRTGIALSLIVAGACGGSSSAGSYYATYPYAQRPPATEATRDRVTANLPTLGVAGVTCNRLGRTFTGKDHMSGEEIPGGFQTLCSWNEGAANETYRIHFVPVDHDITVECLVRANLKPTRCNEIIAALLK